MSPENGRAISDDDVRVIYREIASERVPPELDRRILHQAAAAAVQGNDRNWSGRIWAIAATVAICLVIVTQVVKEPPVPPATTTLRSAEEAKSPRQLSAAALQTEAERQRADKAGKAGGQDGVAAKSAAPMQPVTDTDAADPFATACDEQAIATAQSWLACIRELEDTGKAAAAERERDALRTTFPAFIEVAE